ncbi:MAG TPA: aldehyde dehydrogenase family protein [Candidatus Obscuribacter sp.]|nr:aldehyde dehydrogenase family protein [Candidatus Obscuribacter sp.]HNB14940.1 aldehyde dehydrogenase family protein [Candidatus Obscuribacter sp.]HND07900.1 aldehyde dehydrogenase family protein [Candidatus Obscuribacter sp.]HND66322.1 aldehyde dehydrogenase family protein [Candidatus Obscuribacter sp.]HNG18366.1 aldehyde dehydrogenase family protein [Candidatus Obscuribacter sp.]
MAVVQEKELLCKEFLSRPKQLLIDGKWVNSVSGKTFETLNPATEEVLCRVAEGGKEDVDKAVKAARRAFETGPWRKMSTAERARIMLRLADLIEKHADELAQIETLDNGKPINESRYVDVPQTVETFRYYAGWATKLEGETINANTNFFTYTLREPVGVVGQIIPWNFPMLMLAWKWGPALAAGNCVVLKPAEQTPLSALRIGELALEAGFPDGVINIITGFGADSAGEAISHHMDIDKVAFTGEDKTGKLIVQASTSNLKRVSLELGGKAPNIVFADADIDAAVKGAITGIFFNQGQVCCAGSRLFLEKNIHDEFMTKLTERIGKMRQGEGMDEKTHIGPQVSKEQQERILNYIGIAKGEGAKLACGGEAPAEMKKGYFVKPTVFTGVNNDMRIAQEEVFGPVLAVIPFGTMDEVAEQANKTTFGLSGAVWTRDVKKAHKFASHIKAGTIWVNCYNVFDPAVPFGGYKMSGYGRELGKHSIELYTNIKSVWVNMMD